ncbi:hypothetical protein [Caulobacter endophyticus]|uniref:Uncharacterized protein n=1 Tax=Caulobacter endophyticus TaxID=2172652 RepID=A0A2T9K2T2_9CAUL|nr:hypothetical protein [Caulobacter endophyticus]PVM90292.1 hypothetical protein DDF67_10200 [Caulobacter endophyticus]
MRTRLWRAAEGLLGLVFLWWALGDRITRFVASGGREEAGLLAGVLGWTVAGFLTLGLLTLIDRRLKGQAAVAAYLTVFSAAWLVFSTWVLRAAGAHGAWLTSAALAFGPILIVWGVVFGYLRKAPRP